MTRDTSTRGSRMLCDQGVCKHHAYDMDGAYCAHPKSFEIVPTFGASTNRMSREGHCTGGYADPVKNTRALWEPVE